MGDDQLKETFVSSEDIFDGAIMQVQKWQVTLPDGRQAAREIVLHKGAAAIVPVDADGNVTLVRQHRVAIDEFTWEIPAGKLDYTGEDPLGCAMRELEEETGLRAQNWRKMGHVVTTPGFCTEKISIFLATGLSRHEDHPDPDEFLFVTTLPLAQAVQHVVEGHITDLKTCFGLLMAQKLLADERTPLSAPAFANEFVSGQKGAAI